MMEFAVVRFTDENAPGIVSSNWINRRKDTCWFPNVKSEMKKNKLLMKGTTPGSSWLECPIKVLKEFASYESAKTYMGEVEENSNFEFVSGCKFITSSKRQKSPNFESVSDFITSSKRQKSPICLSDEDSCSEEDEPTRKKSKKHSAYKFHAPFFTEPPNTKLSQNQYQVTFSLPVPTPTRMESIEFPGHSRSDSEVSDNKTASTSQDYLNPSDDQGIMSDIEQIKTNQTNMCNTLAELLTTVKKLECKMDKLLAKSGKQSSHVELDDDAEDMDLISIMPVGIEDFKKLNEKIIKSPSFRQYLRLILKTAGGNKDVKNYVANVLRKLITDDVGEIYSLTGKQLSSGARKQPFEKTAAYKLILQVSFTIFSDARENSVREAISDWLMQSKFRKSRREKRVNSSQPNISFIQAVKEEYSCSNDE